MGKFNNLPMPNQNLSEKEIQQYLAYFHWVDVQPKGSRGQGIEGELKRRNEGASRAIIPA